MLSPSKVVTLFVRGEPSQSARDIGATDETAGLFNVVTIDNLLHIILIEILRIFMTTHYLTKKANLNHFW